MPTISPHEITKTLKKDIRNPADIFLGQPTINFIETKYTNVIFVNRNRDDLFLNLRIFLIFGKCIGLIPIQGLFQKDFEELKYSKSNVSAILNAVIALGLSINACVGIISLGSGGVDHADDYAWAPAMFIFYANGTFLFAFFNRYCEELLQLIHKWNNMRLHFTLADTTLFRDVNLVAGFVLTSAVLENAVAHLKLFPVVPQSESYVSSHQKEGNNTSAWEVYFIRSHGQWADLVHFNIFLALYVFISNKLALYAWNFMDLMVVLMARVVYFKFKALYLQGEAIIFSGNNYADTVKWRQLTKDHETICNYLYDLNKFLSPLIFISYGINIYYICLQLNLGLNPSGNTSTIASIYALWSFLHLIGRVYIVSVSGARINDWAHKINDLFRKCPNEAYITEVERTERFVSLNNVGMSGLGCFIVTKPLLLQIVGVIFTFEIVLLQATQTPLLPPGNSTAAKH